jgi:hypothetical protein
MDLATVNAFNKTARVLKLGEVVVSVMGNGETAIVDDEATAEGDAGDGAAVPNNAALVENGAI